jgi:hypothetical protein
VFLIFRASVTVKVRGFLGLELGLGFSVVTLGLGLG